MSDKFEIKDEEMKKVDGGLIIEGFSSESMRGTQSSQISEKAAGINASNK